MSLEEAITKLTAAVEKNTAALTGGAPAKAASTADATKGSITKDGPKPAVKAETAKAEAKPAAEKKPSAKESAAAADEAYAPVKAITLRLHKEKGRPVVEELQKEFGIEKSAAELREQGREDEYDAYIARAEELLAAEGDMA